MIFDSNEFMFLYPFVFRTVMKACSFKTMINGNLDVYIAFPSNSYVHNYHIYGEWSCYDADCHVLIWK